MPFPPTPSYTYKPKECEFHANFHIHYIVTDSSGYLQTCGNFVVFLNSYSIQLKFAKFLSSPIFLYLYSIRYLCKTFTSLILTWRIEEIIILLCTWVFSYRMSLSTNKICISWEPNRPALTQRLWPVATTSF